jgi:hypothetical protein
MYGIPTALTVNLSWEVAQSKVYRRLGEMYCLHLQDGRLSEENTTSLHPSVGRHGVMVNQAQGLYIYQPSFRLKVW